MTTKPRLRQLAYVTALPDFEATMNFWSDAYGAGPFYIFEVDLENCTFRGEPARTRARVAMTMLGEGQIEIIAPLTEDSSVYVEWMNARGPIPTGGLLHHFRIDTDDFAQTYARLIETGAREGVLATAPGGRTVAYVDAVDTVGTYVEVIEQTADSIALMDRMREVCDSWDGSDPFREYVTFIEETLHSSMVGYARPGA